jgi:hypothetical protein
MPATLLTSVFAGGGRASRYGDFTIVTLHGCCFATTPGEFQQQQGWARTRSSSGDAARDCAVFVDRFDTVIGRDGSGIASKGSRMALHRIIKAMKAAAVFMEGWDVPLDGEYGPVRTTSLDISLA